MVVHSTALASLGTVAILPVGKDAITLRGEEIAMVIAIGKIYGQKLSKSTASGILASSCMQKVGEFIALGLLEVSNATGPAAFVIKGSTAFGLIEMMGMTAIDYFEKEEERVNGYGNNAA